MLHRLNIGKVITTVLFFHHKIFIPANTLRPGMVPVSSCPKNKLDTIKASDILKCGNDKYNNSQYMCLPNTEKSSLMEFCFNGVMGAEEKGNCLEVFEENLTLYSCRTFLNGCPETNYYDNEFYKYPACQNINIKLRCYVADPSCGHELPSEEKSASEITKVLIFLSVGSLFALILFAFIMYLWGSKRKKSRNMNAVIEDMDYPLEDAVNEDMAYPLEENRLANQRINAAVIRDLMQFLKDQDDFEETERNKNSTNTGSSVYNSEISRRSSFFLEQTGRHKTVRCQHTYSEGPPSESSAVFLHLHSGSVSENGSLYDKAESPHC